MVEFDNDLKLGDGGEYKAVHAPDDANGCCLHCGLDVINYLQVSAGPYFLEHIRGRDGVDYASLDGFLWRGSTRRRRPP